MNILRYTIFASSILLVACGGGGEDSDVIVTPEPAPIPHISAADISVIEGDVGVTPAIVELTLSNTTDSEVKVAFATADVTATAGSDYNAASGEVTFAPGETTQQITLEVIGDILYADDDPTEIFELHLSNATGATIQTPNITITIENDDMTRHEALTALVKDHHLYQIELQDKVWLEHGDDQGSGTFAAMHSSFYDIDVNGNGHLDILWSLTDFIDHDKQYNNPHHNHLYINKQGKGFERVKLDVAATGRDIEIFDANGDGLDDIYFAEHGYDYHPFPGHQDSLFLQNNDGSFSDLTQTHVPEKLDFSHGACHGDISGNGYTDVLVAMGGEVKMLNNDGNGKFTDVTTNLPLAIFSGQYADKLGLFEGWDHEDIHAVYRSGYWWCAIADVNNNGHQDIILGGNSSFDTEVKNVHGDDVNFKHLILANDGTGKFTYENATYTDYVGTKTTSDWYEGVSTINMILMDFNGDSCPDMVTQNSNYNGDTWNFHLGDCKGNFTLAHHLFRENHPWHYAKISDTAFMIQTRLNLENWPIAPDEIEELVVEYVDGKFIERPLTKEDRNQLTPANWFNSIYNIEHIEE